MRSSTDRYIAQWLFWLSLCYSFMLGFYNLAVVVYIKQIGQDMYVGLISHSIKDSN